MSETPFHVVNTSETPFRVVNPNPRAPTPQPEAPVLALARLTDAMLMTGSLRPVALDGFRVALKIAMVAAAHGEHGKTVERILGEILKRVDAHAATPS